MAAATGGGGRAGEKGEKEERLRGMAQHLASVVAAAALLVTCVLAVSARLASIIKYESVIHEFDPYFNYRELFWSGR